MYFSYAMACHGIWRLYKRKAVRGKPDVIRQLCYGRKKKHCDVHFGLHRGRA